MHNTAYTGMYTTADTSVLKGYKRVLTSISSAAIV